MKELVITYNSKKGVIDVRGYPNRTPEKRAIQILKQAIKKVEEKGGA